MNCAVNLSVANSLMNRAISTQLAVAIIDTWVKFPSSGRNVCSFLHPFGGFDSETGITAHLPEANPHVLNAKIFHSLSTDDSSPSPPRFFWRSFYRPLSRLCHWKTFLLSNVTNRSVFSGSSLRMRISFLGIQKRRQSTIGGELYSTGLKVVFHYCWRSKLMLVKPCHRK